MTTPIERALSAVNAALVAADTPNKYICYEHTAHIVKDVAFFSDPAHQDMAQANHFADAAEWQATRAGAAPTEGGTKYGAHIDALNAKARSRTRTRTRDRGV